VYTHAGEKPENGSSAVRQQITQESVTIPALERIHQPSLLAQSDDNQTGTMMGPLSRPKRVPVATFFVPRADTSVSSSSHDDAAESRQSMGLFVVNPQGILSFYFLNPKTQVVQNKSACFLF